MRARRCTSSRFPPSQRSWINLRISGSRACSQCPVQSNEKPSITSVRQSPPSRSSASSSVHALPSSRAQARPARPPPITMALPPRRISTRLYHERPAVSLARQQADASVTSGPHRVKISCPNCAAAYELDDSRVPSAGLSIKCPKCKNPFTVHRPKGDAAKTPAKPVAPQPAAKPAAPKATPPRPAMAGKSPASGAVPLPGFGDAPEPPSSSVAESGLPDLDPSVAPERTAMDFRPPPRPSNPATDGAAVPLPGFDEAAVPPPSPPPDDPFAAIDAGAPAPPAPPPEPAAPPPPPPDDDEFAVEPQRRDEFAVEPRRPQAAPKANEEPMSFDFVDNAPKTGAPPDMLDSVEAKDSDK